MTTRRTTDASSSSRRPPVKTPEARENQLIALAVDLAEKQMREGSASAQVQMHYLKLGSSREKLEQEKIKQEILLAEKKAEIMETAARVEELYEGAINAMRSYSGQDPVETHDD